MEYVEEASRCVFKQTEFFFYSTLFYNATQIHNDQRHPSNAWWCKQNKSRVYAPKAQRGDLPIIGLPGLPFRQIC